MKNKTIILILIVAVIILAYFAFLKPKSANNDFQIPVGNIDDNINQSNDQEQPIIVTEENYNEQIEWATAENGYPEDWISWNSKIGSLDVVKRGPVKSDESYFINGLPVSFVLMLPDNKKCVGDNEIASCAVGENSEVIRYFDIISYYD